MLETPLYDPLPIQGLIIFAWPLFPKTIMCHSQLRLGLPVPLLMHAHMHIWVTSFILFTCCFWELDLQCVFHLWKDYLKCYYDQIFTSWFFRRITKNYTKEWKRRLPFANTCISSGGIEVWKMCKICKATNLS